MQRRGVRVVTASDIDLTDDSDTERTMVRKLMGVIAEAEKTRLVRKLKGARDRNAQERGYRTDVRLPGDGDYTPVYDAVRELVTANPAMTLQAICDALTARGVTALRGPKGNKVPGKPFNAAQVRQFINHMGLARVDGRSKAARAA